MAMKIEHESMQFRRTDGVRVTRETWTFRDLELGASYWQVIGESAAEWATWVALHDGLVMVEVHTDRDGTSRITRGRACWDALPSGVRKHLPQIHEENEVAHLAREYMRHEADLRAHEDADLAAKVAALYDLACINDGEEN